MFGMKRKPKREVVRSEEDGNFLVCFLPSGGCYWFYPNDKGTFDMKTGVHKRPAGSAAIVRFYERGRAAVERLANA